MSDAVAVSNGPYGRIGLYQLDRPIANHVHRESHLVFYLEGGNGQAIISDQSFTLTKVTAVAVNPMELHRFAPANNNEACTCLVLYLDPRWLLNTSRTTLQMQAFGQNNIPVNASLRGYVSRLADVLCKDNKERMIDELLYEIYSRSYQSSWVEPQCGVMGRVVSRRIIKSLDAMQGKFLRDGNIESLPKRAGLSRPHFFSLFKQEIGVTPNIYLGTLRVEKAIQDLTETEKKLEKIAFDLGFSSQSSFSRFFSQNVGVPPSVYRDASQS